MTRLVFVAASVLLLAACNPGAYPIDIFPEMHYQVSQRRLEPDRLAPPRDSVPISGRQAAYSFAESGSLPNPVARSAATREQANRLYATNCSMCHGANARGESQMTPYFTNLGRVPPVDLASARVRNRTDGQLQWIITWGLGGMPAFSNLLTETERWTLVHRIRDAQGLGL